MSEQERELLVRAMRWEADGVLSLVLEDPAGAELPSWEPGAHLDLVLPAATRQYSLCGDPADTGRYRIAVLREPASRGGSQHVHEQLRPGELVTVRGPRNRFGLQPADSYLFLAGGIGITPLLPMVARVDAAGAAWSLVYGGRSRRSMAFLDELAGYGDRVQVMPEDECGLLDLDTLLAGVAGGTAVYACGPEGLLTAVEQRATSWPADTLQVERFAARPVEVPEGADESFTLVCQESGITVTVPPERTAVEALEEADVFIPTACREGICGTCEVKVLEGDVDHRDSVLSPAEREAGDTMLLCVSRARGERLVVGA